MYVFVQSFVHSLFMLRIIGELVDILMTVITRQTSRTTSKNWLSSLCVCVVGRKRLKPDGAGGEEKLGYREGEAWC